MKAVFEIWITIVIGVVIWFVLGVAAGQQYCPAPPAGGHGVAPEHGTTN